MMSTGVDQSPQIRPFFGFYGGKWRDSLKNYPSPEFDTVVEPFAGSAGYSVRHSDRKIVLCEIDPTLYGIWSYLIKVKPEEILRIPDVKIDGTVDDLEICQEAKWLVGFWLNRAPSSPRKRPSSWMRSGISPGSFWGDRVRTTIVSQLKYIRHWKIYNCSYEDCPVSKKATWFIDPPYQIAGSHYKYGSKYINYDDLAQWCRQRQGQVIVCENDGATWLPFQHLAEVKTTRSNRSAEAIWYNN